MFKIFVDADSLPTRERNVVLKRAVKDNIATIFVADRSLGDVKDVIAEHTRALRKEREGETNKEERRLIKSTIKMVVVESGEDSADNYIVDNLSSEDLVITHDVGLSERAIEKGASVIDDRGGEFSNENIRERVSQRDYMRAFREMGINDLKQKNLSEKDFQKFSNAFDKHVSKGIGKNNKK